MSIDIDAKTSGMIINTCGWIESNGIELIHDIINIYAIDVVLVMNHDKLYSSLAHFMSKGITVVKLPTSGGIVRRVSQF